MVDRTDIERVSRLVAEYREAELGMRNLNGGGRIAFMIIAPPVDLQPDNEAGGRVVESGNAARISTQDWEYPPGMVAAIVQQLTARRDQINRDLMALGVTGETVSV